MHHSKWALGREKQWHHLSLASPLESFLALQTLYPSLIPTPAVTFQLHSTPSMHHVPSCSRAVALISLLGWMHSLLHLLLTLHVQSDIPGNQSRDLRLSVMWTVSAFTNFDKHLIYCLFNSMECSSTSKHFHLYLVYNIPKILTIIFLLFLISSASLTVLLTTVYLESVLSLCRTGLLLPWQWELHLHFLKPVTGMHVIFISNTAGLGILHFDVSSICFFFK